MNTKDVYPGGKVNHRAVNMVGKSLDFANVNKEYLFEGLGYTAQTCPEWIPWNSWVQVIDRLAEETKTDEALREVGFHVFKGPSAMFLLRLVGFFADLGTMLMRMNELIMRSFFKGLEFETIIDKKKNSVEARITIPEDLVACRAYLVMSSAAYEAIFKQLKVSYKDFQYSCTDRTAVYTFNYKASLGFFERIRSVYRVIVGADYAVKRIADNEDELRRRLEIVEAARAEAVESREKEHAAREIAEEALQVRQRFLAVMSHELRTPLNHIIGCASILLSEEMDEDKRDYVDIIQRSSYSLLELIELILDFTSAGTLSGENPQRLSLSDLLDPIIDNARFSCEQKNLVFEFPMLEGDQTSLVLYAGHLKRILKLLLDNAIKFTTEGTISLEIASLDNDELCFSINDSGIGIPEDWQKEIFKPFRAVDSSDTRSVGGIGLGLTIARKLAREIGGDLELSQSSKEGSSFILTIPVNMNENEERQQKTSTIVVDDSDTPE
ncbi:MAG: sensor histidine kinase [Rhodothermales bacterium]